jgi:uncharacterized protein YpuA (DUF1002 family)
MKIIHRCAYVKKALTHLQYKAKNNNYDFDRMKNDINNAKFHLKELTLLINRYEKKLCTQTQQPRN